MTSPPSNWRHTSDVTGQLSGIKPYSAANTDRLESVTWYGPEQHFRFSTFQVRNFMLVKTNRPKQSSAQRGTKKTHIGRALLRQMRWEVQLTSQRGQRRETSSSTFSSTSGWSSLLRTLVRAANKKMCSVEFLTSQILCGKVDKNVSLQKWSEQKLSAVRQKVARFCRREDIVDRVCVPTIGARVTHFVQQLPWGWNWKFINLPWCAANRPLMSTHPLTFDCLCQRRWYLVSFQFVQLKESNVKTNVSLWSLIPHQLKPPRNSWWNGFVAIVPLFLLSDIGRKSTTIVSVPICKEGQIFAVGFVSQVKFFLQWSAFQTTRAWKTKLTLSCVQGKGAGIADRLTRAQGLTSSVENMLAHLVEIKSHMDTVSRTSEPTKPSWPSGMCAES